jgi:peptidoglycan/LPS O-acetylase OafA/YrhL
VNDNLLSLRGFAALSVLIFHAMLAFKVANLDTPIFRPISWTNPMHFMNQIAILLTNGGAAVTFFFVHSGFVLTLSLSKHFNGLNVARIPVVTDSYYQRRFFRLFPVIVVSVLAGFAFYHLAYAVIPNPPASAWLSGFFPRGGDLRELLLNFTMMSQSLNKFLWSLLVETELSLLMPLLYFVVRGANAVIVAMVLFLGWAAVAHVAYPIQAATSLEPDVWLVHKFTSTFILCFLAGSIATTITPKGVALVRRSVIDRVPAIRRLSGSHLNVIALVVLIAARPYSGLSLEFAVWIELLASVVIIYNVYYNDTGWLQRLSSRPISRFYGRISDSLYMFSAVSIYAAAMIVFGILGHDVIIAHGLLANLVTLVLSLLIVTVVSHLSFVVIEAPLMKFGKELSRRIEGSRPMREFRQA